MGRLYLVGLQLCASCSFALPGGSGASPDSPTPGDDAAAGGDAGVFTCATAPRRWLVDFSVDPTTLDTEQDPALDWAVRGGGTFPAGELVGGSWVASSSLALDTQPKLDFLGRTHVAARMRATGAGGIGATVWINVDYAAGMFAPLWMTMQLAAANGQVFRVHGKQLGNDDVVLADLPIAAGLVTAALDIDPATGMLSGSVEGVAFGPVAFPRLAVANDDRFLTVIAYATPSEFDYVELVTCE